ncbi:uncharacterized protein N7503_009048 [Penicillium pulvis]|uniref:uncharacterized protein n=1 Tax=Penicillium pulvis TaxID=1562058 RepID=UPI0025489CED|nr:uncharacterized protein N7503_009048 [Penicillium pulvis]KAJ5793070.1 hypothetical protein N7503_009048 [Penicillium pulvis]
MTSKFLDEAERHHSVRLNGQPQRRVREPWHTYVDPGKPPQDIQEAYSIQARRFTYSSSANILQRDQDGIYSKEEEDCSKIVRNSRI